LPLLLRLLELLLRLLEPLLRLLELLLFPPPRRSCAITVGAANTEGKRNAARTNVPNLFIKGNLFMPSPCPAPNRQAGVHAMKDAGLSRQYTPGYLKGELQNPR
jgi:hypothetical protein